MGSLDIYGAGLAPAGFGAAGDATPYVEPSLPVALQYDGATGDWIIDSGGEYATVHPVDQGVALALCVPRGSIRYARSVGSDIKEIDDLSEPGLRGRVEDAVKTAIPLASYLADGSVTIRSIDYETRPAGGLVVRVVYQNNLLERTATVTT